MNKSVHRDTIPDLPEGPSHADQALLHSGHEADAARAMEGIDGYTDQAISQEEKARDANGRFAKNQAEQDTDSAAEPEDSTPAPAEDGDQQQAADDGEQDFLELPVDDGDPERIALEDVVQGYKRAKELETELENVRSVAPAPPDYDQALMETVQQGQQYAERLAQMQQMILPQVPNERLVDPNSDHYDPDEYHNQLRAYRYAEARWSQLEQERQQVMSTTQEQAEAANSLKFEREQARLHEFWPEIKNNTVAKGVRDDLEAYYRIDSELVDTIHDSRFFQLAKDALAYRAQQKQGEKTAKAVKAKPKLVKGSRNPRAEGNRQTRDRGSMERLAEEGTEEAAAAALRGLKIL